MIKLLKDIVLIFAINILLSDQYTGYLKIVEASFCMDECSHYFLETEQGSYISNISFIGDINPELYINRFVEIEGEEIWCIECGAILAETIDISDDCDEPFSCFVNPCDVADDCLVDTPVECIPNYCGGCNADFYDLNDNLINCFNQQIEPCDDIGGVFFGFCDMFLGYAIVNGVCEGVSGCDWEFESIDYSNAFFNNLEDCESSCTDESNICDEIEYDYNLLHHGVYTECNEDSDCISVWGECAIGLGGCHYSINESIFNQNEINNLIDSWIYNECVGGVCDCMPLPDSFCNNGFCDLGYCVNENPAGCFTTGCSEDYGCVDYEYSGDCVPSWCDCDELYGEWFCTEDCNGGTCFQLGDVNYDEILNVIDAVLIIDVVLNFSEPLPLSDVNLDGNINIVDVVLLINFILD